MRPIARLSGQPYDRDMNNTAKFHVLAESAALSLDIIDADGVELEHSASESAVAAAAESSQDERAAAYAAARAEGGNRWVIDGEGNSHYVREVA